ncbi:ABC transporter permease [Deinococcus irradiatisoli]
MRFWKLLRIYLSASLSVQLAYRANFLAAVLSSLANIATGLLGVLLFYSRPEITQLGGWNLEGALMVVGFFTLTQGVISVWLRPNLQQLSEGIRTGTLDFLLLKPVDAQFQLSSRNLNLLRLPDILLGLALIVWSAARLGTVSLSSVLLAAALYLSALAMVYAIWFMLNTTAFWLVNVQNITELFQGVFSAGRYPLQALPLWIRPLLTFVVPVAFITTIPAQALRGELGGQLALLSFVVAVLLLALCRLLWLRALGSYTSASS